MSKIRQLYFYIVTLIGLLMIILPTADLINLGLRTWVFPKVEEAEYAIYPHPVGPPGTERQETVAEQDARIQKEQAYSKLQRRAHRQRDAIRDISFLIVGLPLFIFHFRVVQREKSKD